jgi:hypothetical protein
VEIIALLWVVSPILAGFVAASKGRNPFVWIVATLIFPISLFFLLFGGQARKCPYCAEGIKREALICPHCQRELPDP